MDKKEIFQYYSKNLEMVSKAITDQGKLIDKYLCPICLSQFNTYDELTIEHIPPKSVGGKRKVLTCKTCNNTQGGQLDSQLPKILNSKAFFKRIPSTNIDTSFHVEGLKTDGTTSISLSGELKFKFDSSRTSPANNYQIKSLLETGDAIKIEAKFKTGKLKSSILSIIRSGYLWAFSEMGYSFIFNPNLNPYRGMIINNDPQVHADGSVIVGEFSKDFEGVNVITNEEYKSWLIIFQINANNYSEYVGVNLPGSNIVSNTHTLNFRNFINSNNGSTFNLNKIETTNMLVDPHLSILPYYCWL